MIPAVVAAVMPTTIGDLQHIEKTGDILCSRLFLLGLFVVSSHLQAVEEGRENSEYRAFWVISTYCLKAKKAIAKN